MAQANQSLERVHASEVEFARADYFESEKVEQRKREARATNVLWGVRSCNDEFARANCSGTGRLERRNGLAQAIGVLWRVRSSEWRFTWANCFRITPFQQSKPPLLFSSKLHLSHSLGNTFMAFSSIQFTICFSNNHPFKTIKIIMISNLIQC